MTSSQGVEATSKATLNFSYYYYYYWTWTALSQLKTILHNITKLKEIHLNPIMFALYCDAIIFVSWVAKCDIIVSGVCTRSEINVWFIWIPQIIPYGYLDFLDYTLWIPGTLWLHLEWCFFLYRLLTMNIWDK